MPRQGLVEVGADDAGTPVRVAYELHGGGPVRVLLVPGMCVSRRMWEPQLRVFARWPEIYSLCLIDNRGSGDSDVPPAGVFDARNQNYRIETLARDAWTVVDELFGPDAKVHIAGWSMGSMVAQRIALLRLDRVASLALLSSHAGGWFWSNVPSVELAQAALDVAWSGFDVDVTADVQLRLHYTDAFLEEFIVDGFWGKRLRREQYRERYRSGIAGDTRKDADGHAFWGHLATVRDHNLTEEDADALRDAPFECLVIYGHDDRVVTAKASEDLARRIGAARKAVSGAHMIVDESAHDVNLSLVELWKTGAPLNPEPHLLGRSYLLRSLSKWTLSFT